MACRHSNPVDVSVAYRGGPDNYGTAKDPMVGGRIGGVNVFGGGLALYNAQGVLVGAIGVSGDSSCADHNIAWRTRNALKLDPFPAASAPTPAGPTTSCTTSPPRRPDDRYKREWMGTPRLQRCREDNLGKLAGRAVRIIRFQPRILRIPRVDKQAALPVRTGGAATVGIACD